MEFELNVLVNQYTFESGVAIANWVQNGDLIGKKSMYVCMDHRPVQQDLSFACIPL